MSWFSRYREKPAKYSPRRKVGQTFVWNYPGPEEWFGGSLYLNEWTSCRDSLHKGPPFKDGGDFQLVRVSIPDVTVSSGEWSTAGYTYRGSFVWAKPGNLTQDLLDLSDFTAFQFGATGWNKFRPVKPKVGLGQFLVELREAKDLFGSLPAVLKNPPVLGKLSPSARDAGGAYLNYRFGWLPTIKDIAKAVKLMHDTEKVVARIRRDNGKWIRRGGVFRNDTQTDTYEVPSRIFPTLVSPFYPGWVTTNCTVTRKVTDKLWFRGVMKYYIPSLKGDKVQDVFTSPLLRKLYGLELSPEQIWSVLPWSWFVDWFGNFGDFMANFGNQLYDNLVAKYAYVMRHRKIEYEYTQDQPMVGGPALHLSAKCFVESKERSEASPYGFGAEWPDFTARQQAILAALGVTRAPRFR